MNQTLKKILLFFRLIPTSPLRFNQTSYIAGDVVIVNGTANVLGVENGLVSNPYSQSNSSLSDTIIIGSNPTAGVYPLTFNLVDGSQQSVLITLANAIGTDSVTWLGNVISFQPEQQNILLAIFEFFKLEQPQVFFDVLGEAALNFGTANGVSLIENVAVCYAVTETAGTSGVLDAMCKSLSEDNLKALVLEIYKSLFSAMKNKGYITLQQYQDIQIDDYVNITNMLKNDCGAFFDFLAEKIDQPDVKMALKYEGQLCSTAVSIIKVYKLP